MSVERLVVVGAGAIGGSIGGLVAQQGVSVALVARGEHGSTISKNGLLLRQPTGSIRVHPTCYESIETVQWQQGDLALLATKLGDAESALDDILKGAGSKIPVACATNGVHAERWAAERFENVASVLVWMPATFLVPGEVSLFCSPGPGILDCGPVKGDSTSAEALVGWLSNAGFDSQICQDITNWKYAKWITNLGNAAQALVEGDWLSIGKMAQAEGRAVLAKAGYDRVTVEQLKARTKELKLVTIDGENRKGGSTWQSFQRGKPLESPWLEGAMADLGDELGVPAPICRFMSDAAANPRTLTVEEVLKGAKSLPNS